MTKLRKSLLVTVSVLILLSIGLLFIVPNTRNKENPENKTVAVENKFNPTITNVQNVKNEKNVLQINSENSSIWFTLLSSIFFIGIIGIYTYRKTKGVNDTTNGYFLAGRGMSGGFIAGALILTNLSAEQTVGLNGQAYGGNSVFLDMLSKLTAGIL